MKHIIYSGYSKTGIRIRQSHWNAWALIYLTPSISVDIKPELQYLSGGFNKHAYVIYPCIFFSRSSSIVFKSLNNYHFLLICTFLGGHCHQLCYETYQTRSNRVGQSMMKTLYSCFCP